MSKFARSFLCGVLTFLFAMLANAQGGPGGDSVWTEDPSAWKVEIYPIYAWAPIMGASVTLPEFPNLPSSPDVPGTPRPSGSATGSFNGAAFFAFRIEKSKFSFDGNALWAAVSAERTDPYLKIKLDAIYGQAMGGYEVLPNLFLEGGFRRMALNISAKVLNFDEVSRKPGVTDPLVGLTYHKPFGRKWRLVLHADGGGFGVGSDESIAAAARLDWRFAKHFGTSFGYGVLHFKISNTVLQRTLTLDQTLNGPVLGFGIYF